MVAMLVLSATEMQACDRATTERYGIAPVDLMRAAAAAVSDFARSRFPEARSVTVLCGRGNNGGDGMMAARLLAGAGLKVTTLLLGAAEGLSADVETAWNELRASAAPGTVHAIEAADDLAKHSEALKADLMVDGVVGTGFKLPLRGLARETLACRRP